MTFEGFSSNPDYRTLLVDIQKSDTRQRTQLILDLFALDEDFDGLGEGYFILHLDKRERQIIIDLKLSISKEDAALVTELRSCKEDLIRSYRKAKGTGKL